MFIRDAQLLLRADHRIRLDPADFSALERDQHLAISVSIVNLGAFLGIGHFQRFCQRACAFELEQVRRAGQHHMLLLAVEELAQYQPVGVGVRHHFQNGGNHQLLGVPFDPVQAAIA